MKPKEPNAFDDRLVKALGDAVAGRSEADQELFNKVNAARGDTSVLNKHEARRFKRLKGKGIGRLMKSMERDD